MQRSNSDRVKSFVRRILEPSNTLAYIIPSVVYPGRPTAPYYIEVLLGRAPGEQKLVYRALREASHSPLYSAEFEIISRTRDGSTRLAYRQHRWSLHNTSSIDRDDAEPSLP